MNYPDYLRSHSPQLADLLRLPPAEIAALVISTHQSLIEEAEENVRLNRRIAELLASVKDTEK